MIKKKYLANDSSSIMCSEKTHYNFQSHCLSNIQLYLILYNQKCNIQSYLWYLTAFYSALYWQASTKLVAVRTKAISVNSDYSQRALARQKLAIWTVLENFDPFKTASQLCKKLSHFPYQCFNWHRSKRIGSICHMYCQKKAGHRKY